MNTMQEKILAAVAAEIEECMLEPVVHSNWANTGVVHGMDGLATIVTVAYDFQSEYVTLTLASPGLVLAEVGIVDNLDGTPRYRVHEGTDDVVFHAIGYSDGDRLRSAVAMIGTLVNKFRGLA